MQMTTKTQTSSISLKTLRGVFEEPKMNHRRDFLRENKLNLRQLQKNTTQKLTQQKQEFERKQNKHLQNFHKTQEQTLVKRSASQSRNIEQNEARHSRISVVNDECGGMCVKSTATRGRPSNPSYKRAYSQQRNSVEQLYPDSRCYQQQKQQNSETQHRQRIPRSASTVSVLSKAESCDKEIQTEDIHDEDFLYEALKKCSSTEVQQLHKQKSIGELHNGDNNLYCSYSNNHLHQCESEIKSTHSQDRAAETYHDHYVETKSQQDHMPQLTSRSQNTHLTNGHNCNNELEEEIGLDNDLEHFQNLKIEQPLSARSRQTLCSIGSKKRTGSVHKLGSRDDLRLPRYLEKEKREKEEQRLRESNRDPNCPLGYYSLSEEERLKALKEAQQKMASLINELNHMPMTSETLRLRSRKAEIEKELTQIELDIRLYSKAKVYVAEQPVHY